MGRPPARRKCLQGIHRRVARHAHVTCSINKAQNKEWTRTALLPLWWERNDGWVQDGSRGAPPSPPATGGGKRHVPLPLLRLQPNLAGPLGVEQLARRHGCPCRTTTAT